MASGLGSEGRTAMFLPCEKEVSPVRAVHISVRGRVAPVSISIDGPIYSRAEGGEHIGT